MTLKFLLPDPNDNAAIAAERIEAGERIDIDGRPVTIRTVVPKGHRLSVRQIEPGEPLLSWGYPFGHAATGIEPGDYLCNARMKDVLAMRNPGDYPEGLTVNFVDRDTTQEQTLPANPVLTTNPRSTTPGAGFMGYRRGPARGWGTRNTVAVIGVTSRARSLVLAATDDLQEHAHSLANVDALAPVVHTEGGNSAPMHNKQLLLRTLAGFATNPNVAAAVFVNDPDSPISNAELLQQLASLGASHLESTIRYFVADTHFEDSLRRLTALVLPLLDAADKCFREPAPLEGLKLGLQCGGSDAFSGVTANPLLGTAVQELLVGGATANLAETDELIGAEEHVLARVADGSVAGKFLEKQNNFKNYAERHHQTAEGNVSGGNLYRGLYNITLKSLGAGRKKDPATALEQVIGYGEPMTAPGYYFMDSPGNDLESIAGQVASGANLILFTTGNGSITNFPFVPTIKIVTTSERFRLLQTDMDFNAGALLEGEDPAESAHQLIQLTLRTASGERSKGEYTGQSQVQIWRDWRQADRSPGQAAGVPHVFSGEPLVRTDAAGPQQDPLLTRSPGTGRRVRAIEILPTSLCSGQVAEQIAASINDSLGKLGATDLWNIVALPHTEGCGVSGGDAEEVYTRTMLGYATHPAADHTIFLEHGCEKTHNDYFKDALGQRGIDASGFGFASIQHAGGIAAVTSIVEDLVRGHIREHDGRHGVGHAPTQRIIGLATTTKTTRPTAEAAVELVRRLLALGTSVVIGETDQLLSSDEFLKGLGVHSVKPTLPYAGKIHVPGLHVMQTSSSDWLEVATGLGATGAETLLVFAGARPVQPHRMLPVLQVATAAGSADPQTFDIAAYSNDPSATANEIANRIEDVHRGTYTPILAPRPNVGFQVSRGFWGVSL